MSLYEALAHIADDRASRDGVSRYGVVSAVDPDNHACKVTIQPDGNESGWIPDPGLAAAGLKIACPCEIGTHVLVTFAEGDAEHPVISGRLFDTTTQPPVSPVTSKPAQPGEFLVANGGTFLHLQSGTVTIGAQQNSLSIGSSGITFMVGGQSTTLTGSEFTSGVPIQVTGDVVAGQISVQQHVHGGVQSGSSTTAKPVG